VSYKEEALSIFDISLPSVEIFLKQFLSHIDTSFLGLVTINFILIVNFWKIND